eukprot:Plantae.Rhodophyta-Hildenbrandia_rubra.ctg11365.p2 GENE.Plantae.Rhodophyta-Hildenbrandia_rubra.ctg11365~~Plantae.Rhodophyta-Hildenbrandia_rubra.ctg11365.p2  ORF type:complete len:578 (+),score=134.87 Plantae.Rhodophyta-Hildenbrandia_rubra.ctg11365:133-1734(+)
MIGDGDNDDAPLLSPSARAPPSTNASGYIDDEVDLDDDLDDEPLVTPTKSGTPRRKASRKEKAGSGANKLPPVSVRDYTLRGGGDVTREYIVGRFMHRMPEIAEASGARMYREGEGRMSGRKMAMSADRKQKNYYNSFIGKRRLERNAKAGLNVIPDRVRKGWELEVLWDRDGKRGVVDGGGSLQKQFYKGEFEGRNMSRYAVFVMNREDRTVDVLPIGHLAWYGFRLHNTSMRQRPLESTEDVEKKMVQSWKKGVKKLNRLHNTYDQAQEKVELQLGGVSVPKKEEGVAAVGLHRNEERDDEEEKEENEGMDFDENFDDDDVAQVDPDLTTKAERTQGTLRNGTNEMKKFREMIKDEPIASSSSSRPGSPTSDSDEEYAGARRSLSPPPKRLRSPGAADGQPPAKRIKRESSTGAVAGAAAAASTPSGSIPQAQVASGPVPLSAYSHLLPQGNENPTREHIINILTFIQDMGRNISLKEIVRAFGYKTKSKRQMLQKILKEVAYTKPAGPREAKEFHVFLRNGFVRKAKIGV